MKIVRTIEFDIEANTHRQITELRNKCFPKNQSEYSYYKQLPHFRYLAFDDEKSEFMIKPTGTKTWNDEPIDLLGYMF